MSRLPLTPGLRLQDLPPPAARFCLDMERFCRGELAPDLGLDLAGKAVLAAVSGGADSLALLLALHCLSPRLGCSLLVAHLDHGLRPESASESAQVAEIAKRLGLACVSGKADVAALAQERGVGLEEAARIARLDFLERTRQERGCDWIALGHQLNDLAEDSLMRLMRGTGWPGLAGMEACDPARRLFRPLLLTPRSSVDVFVAVFGLVPAQDAMNEDTAYLRSRVRKNVLPLFTAENPAFLDSVAQRWLLARRDAAYFASVLPEEEDGPDRDPFLSRETLDPLPEALRLRLYKRVLDHLGPGQALAETLFALDTAWREKRGGKRFAFPGGKSALVHKGGIQFFHG